MKISLYLALLGATLCPTLVRAQPLPVPATFMADEAQVLTPDFVREADVIFVGRLSPDRRAPGIARPGMTGFESIRGDLSDIGRGLVVPTGETIGTGANSKIAILFAKTDPIRQQPVLLASLDATPERIERVKKLARENQKITVTFSTDKPSYGPDDPIILKWQARNTSPQPQRIYTGQYALQSTAIYGGTGRGGGTGGSQNRTESDYVTLAPGEVWSDTRTIRGPFPQGEVTIKMTLDSSDNFLGSDPRSAKDRAERERATGVALFKAQDSISVEIKPPSPDEQKALIGRLSSPNWSEALAAATTLSQLQGASEIPAMRALATHPWSALRLAAANALARDATAFGPQLRALVFDADPRVRNSTLEKIYKNQAPGAGLAALAVMAVENEAIEKGFLSDTQKSLNAEYAIFKAREGNRDLGDLLAARIEAGHATDNGINAPYLLNLLAENQSNTHLSGEKVATPEEEKEVLQAWKTAPEYVKPANLKSRTAADLDAEIKVARAAMFDNFQVGPQFFDIVKNLQTLGSKIYPKPEDEDWKFFQNIAPAARVDVLRALQWGTGESSRAPKNAPVLQAVAQIDGPQKIAAGNFLLGLVYGALNRNLREGIYVENDVAFAAAVALGYGDADFARPHLESALQSDNKQVALGAATGLLLGGQKSALPVIFKAENENALSSLPFEEVQSALEKTTGLTFKNRTEWKKWWDETGSKMEGK